MLTYFPKFIANKSVSVFLISLLVVTVAFHNHAMPLWLIVISVGTVLMFFFGSNSLTKSWAGLSPKAFSSKLFWGAFLIRLAYVIFVYYFNQAHYGTYHESDPGDIGFYVSMGRSFAESALGRAPGYDGYTWVGVMLEWNIEVSDMGYIVYLAALYTITGLISEVLLPLMVKAFLGAWVCVFIYNMARRHFSEEAGRMAGIFCMLQFSLIWWCGSMMKEAEMIFIFIWFADNADKLFYEKQTSPKNWILAIGLALLLYTFRAALSMVAFLSMFCQVLMSSNRVMGAGRKAAVGVVVAAALLAVFGDSLQEELRETQEIAGGQYQEVNMNWRAEREGGNSFAKYAGAAVFAPLIFTIPFPTVIYTSQNQEMQMMVSGGNYEKNVMSIFVIYVMFYLLLKGEWRKHVFPVALLCGYLVALVLSVFAQSGRFHMPAVPLEMFFAAYGVTLMQNKHKKWFNYAIMVEGLAIVAWSWFKLAGRGLI